MLPILISVPLAGPHLLQDETGSGTRRQIQEDRTGGQLAVPLGLRTTLSSPSAGKGVLLLPDVQRGHD